MYYHPLIGIGIFLIAIIISFVLGRIYITSKQNKVSNLDDVKSVGVPKGEITSPDAPWLDKK